MRRSLVLILVLLARAPARAEPIAISVNAPWSWRDAQALALSVNVGLAPRLALRGNVASYNLDYTNDVNDGMVGLLGGTDGPGIWYDGRHFDASVSALVYVYAPRPWTGLYVEAGPLVRLRDVRISEWDYATEEETVHEPDTWLVGGRLLVGTSARIGSHGFAAMGAGFSLGYEHGDDMGVAVRRTTAWPELYVRIGAAFGR